MKHLKLFFGAIFLLLFGCQSVEQRSMQGLYCENHLEFKKWNREAESCCEAKGKKIAIASGGPLSSQAGVRISEAGGNIIDVAVAVCLALNVERTQSTSLGGGGFMLVHLNGKKVTDSFVDFRETAPRKISTKDFLDEKGVPIARGTLDGAKAVATPGMVAGLYDIHKKWGKLQWAKVVEPSIEIARTGFAIYPSLAEKIESRKTLLLADPYSENLLYSRQGEPKKTGERLVQEDLARTLERLAAGGKAVFYEGDLGKQIVSAVKARGGVLDEADLKHYQVRFRKPIKGNFQGYTYLTAPPPSAGGVLISEVLNVLSPLDLKAESQDGVQYLHLLAETMKRGYADRSDLIGDPDTLPRSKAAAYQGLLSKAYADSIRNKLNRNRATPSSEVSPSQFAPKDSRGTTQVSIIDDQGNAISATLTLNTGNFGSGLAVPGTGIFLNNEMDDFTLLPGKENAYGLVSSAVNEIQPGRRPVSSMTPTLVFKDSVPVLAVGGAGGSKIISAVLSVLMNTLVLYEGDVRKAIYAPRIHHQWLPDKLDIEPGFSSHTRQGLEARGYTLADPTWSAEVHAVYRDKDGGLTGAIDPRNQGGAAAR